MKCQFCQKEINNPGGLKKHEKGCLQNPQRIIYRSNFLDYNQKVRDKEIIHKNQYTLARERGEEWEMPEEAIKKWKEKYTGFSHSAQTKEKLSLSRAKTIEELGVGGFKNIKWYRISNIQNEEFIVRGLWELSVANLLNEEKILWIRKIYIKYKDLENINRIYTPDFYLPDYDLYIEVKGFFSSKDKQKLEFVLEQNDIDLIIIDSKIIQDREAILKLIT
jgi:hypothetical protein